VGLCQGRLDGGNVCGALSAHSRQLGSRRRADRHRCRRRSGQRDGANYPTSFYEELVAMGGGLMRGEIMLRGWKGMNPVEHYITEHIDLYEHIDDPAYLRKKETFEAW
jgi:hypothetical protein